MSSNLLMIALATYSLFFAVIGMSSIVARYGRDIGLTVSEVGLVFSATPMAAALLRIPFGVAADRIGVRSIMALGGLFAFAAGLLASRAETGLELATARIMQGVALAAFVAPSIAAAGFLKGVEVDRAVSVRSASIAAASSSAPFLVSIIVDRVGYYAAFTVVGVAGLVSTIASLMLELEESRERGRWSIGMAIASTSTVLPLLFASLADGLVFFSLQALPQEELRDLGYPATVYGTALTLNGVAGVVARLSAPRAARRLNPFNTIYLGYGFAITGLTLLYASSRPPLIYVAYTLYGIGLGLVVPMEQFLLLSLVPGEVRGTVTSIYALMFDIGGVVGTNMYSYVVLLAGYRGAYMLMPLNEMVPGILIYVLARRVSHTRAHHILSIATHHHDR